MDNSDVKERLSQYHPRFEWLGDELAGKTQVWLCYPLFLARPPAARFPSWHEDYEFVAVVDTDDLGTAYRVTKCWEAWNQRDKLLQPVFPYGFRYPVDGESCEPFLPRATTVGDVLIQPDGTIHMIREDGYLRIG